MRHKTVAETDNAGVRSGFGGVDEKESHGAAYIADYRASSVAQRQLIDDIRVSPRVEAQRRGMSAVFGDTAQRVAGRDPSPGGTHRREAVQLHQMHDRSSDTGLPDSLKAGIESLSGISMDGVKVHYNSSQPAQLNALAYAQGSDIHLAPGQEAHLPHEAWHVVQQAQGRVAPTRQMKDAVPINDDDALEREADVMGARALEGSAGAAPAQLAHRPSGAVVQRFIDIDNGNQENGVEPIGVAGHYVAHHGAIYLETAVGTFYIEPTGAGPVPAQGEGGQSSTPGTGTSVGLIDSPPSVGGGFSTPADFLVGDSQSGLTIGTDFPSSSIDGVQQPSAMTFLPQPGLATHGGHGATSGDSQPWPVLTLLSSLPAPSTSDGGSHSTSGGGFGSFPTDDGLQVPGFTLLSQPSSFAGDDEYGLASGSGMASLPVDDQQVPPFSFLPQLGLPASENGQGSTSGSGFPWLPMHDMSAWSAPGSSPQSGVPVVDDAQATTGGASTSSLASDDHADLQPIGPEDDQIELDLSPDEENIEEDDEPEKSTKDSRNHYLNIIEEDLRQAQKNFEEDSSDSDIDEDDPDIRAGKYTKKELEAARRKRKSMDLEAIMSTAEPVGDDEMERIKALESGRETDVKSRKGKRGRYTKATIKMLRERGLDMKRTNLYHNTYLRRAVREATTSGNRTSSTSGEYDSRQKVVRDKLLQTIVADNKKMAWKEEDFSSKEKWNIFQWMLKNKWSNPSSGVRLHQKTDIKPDDKANPRAAFHHIYWKESEGARSSKFALTPANLTLRHDEREMDPKKKRQRIEKGQTVYKPGSHEYDHRTNGYQKDDAARFPERWQSGGHFSAIDPEAVAHTIKPMLAKRAKKLEAAKKLVDKSRKRRRSSGKTSTPTDNTPSVAPPMPDVAPPTLDFASVLPGLTPATLDVAQPDVSSLAADASQEVMFDNGMVLSLLSFTDEEIAALQEFVDELRAEHMQNQPRAQTVNGSDLQSNIVGVGALEQFEHECGQMAVFNASILRQIGNNTMHDVLGDPNHMAAFRAAANDQPSLNAVGAFHNDVDEAQVMTMLEQINATDVAVVNNYQQLQGILQSMRQGDQQALADQLGDALYQQYLPGMTAVLDFIGGVTPVLNLVVNTAANAGEQGPDADEVLHWIAVRVERHVDGSLQIFFMDSLNGAHSYTDLLHGLRALLR